MLLEQAMKERRPNVIYILGDDHRHEYLGCAGHPVLKTPHLDRLANDGVRFTHTFCTSPACTPSRASHYTGQWERRHGINFNSGSSLAPETWETSFPMRLKRDGYFIGWGGKNHVPVGGGQGGYDSGYLERAFDYWYGNHHHSGFYPAELVGIGEIYRNAEADTQVEVFTEGVSDFLEPNAGFRERSENSFPERPTDRPFCLCVTFNLPHDVGIVTMEDRESDDALYRTAYRDKAHLLQAPATYVPYKEAVERPRLPRDVYSGDTIPSYDYAKDPESLREQQVRGCQTVSGMDRFVGRLREQLERLGLADNTIIVFSTDHGIQHGEHGIGGKCFLYEESLRIPLIIHDPRIERGDVPCVRDEFVVVPDLAPTILDLCGLEPSAGMQGRSLRPLLENEQPDWRSEVFTEQLMDLQNYPRSESVRTAEWKYIRYFARTEDPAQAESLFRGTLDDYNRCLSSTLNGEEPVYEELFNLREDPGEVENLAPDAGHAGRLDELRTRLLALAREAKGERDPPPTIPNV